MESFIKAENNGKNICMVYAHNDDMVIGAIQAIKARAEAGQRYPHRLYRRRAGYLQSDDRGEEASVRELTPNMAGPAFDALEKYKKDGTCLRS
jgi:simple sugar transport system substrate-binding protein